MLESPLLSEWLAADRSEYAPAPPGLWNLVGAIMEDTAAEIAREDGRRRFLETSPADLFSDYSGARRRLIG